MRLASLLATTGRILILGAGGHARVVADVARSQGLTVVGYADADPERAGQIIEGSLRVISSQRSLMDGLAAGAALPGDAAGVVVAVGSNRTRLELCHQLLDVLSPPLGHNIAVVSPSAKLGRGTVVMPKAVINASAWIGMGVIVNTGAIVEHDCRIADGAHIAPGAVLTGAAKVGYGSFVGAGATVLPRVSVGAHVMVGAGAVVTRDLPDGVVAYGNPARVVRDSWEVTS